MRSLDYAAELPIVGDVGTVAATIVSVCAAVTAVAAIVRSVRSSRRTARARALRIGWQPQSDSTPTGALVFNESKETFQKIAVTVTCGPRGRTARRDIAVLKAGEQHLWPSEAVHRSVKSSLPAATLDEKHHDSPHAVHVTFRDGKGYWSRDDEQLDRVRSLVVWAEHTRAATLSRYFGKRSRFRRTYSVNVRVESFERTELLEKAFVDLASTGRPPAGYQVPDVVAGPHDWIGRVVHDDAVLEPPFDPVGLSRLSPVAIDALTSEEQLYGIPYVFDSVALIRNDTLAGNGLMPATFEEALRAGAEAAEAAGITGGAGVALQVGAPDSAGNAGDPYHLWPLFSSAGGTFFGWHRDPDGTDRFDDISEWRDGFVDAFAKLATLGGTVADKLRPDLGRADALPMFLDGRAPFLVCSSRALSSIADRGMNVTVAPVPPLGDSPAVPLVSVYGLYIYPNAPNLPAARDLVTSYLSEAHAGEDLNKLQQLVPVQQDAMSAVASNDTVLRPYVEQCKRGVIMPAWQQMRAAWQLLGTTEYRVLAGDGDPREVAGAAAEQGWELLAPVRDRAQR